MEKSQEINTFNLWF